jgi:hypothetical protein
MGLFKPLGAPSDIPGTHADSIFIPAAAAADATAATSAWTAPFDCTITGIKFYPVAAITGAATNNRTTDVYLANGSTNIATLNWASGVNGTIGTAKTIVLTATVSNLDLASGASIIHTSTKVGTGLALPAGTLRIEYTRR